MKNLKLDDQELLEIPATPYEDLDVKRVTSLTPLFMRVLFVLFMMNNCLNGATHLFGDVC